MRVRSMVGLGLAGWLLNAAVLTPRRFRIFDVPLHVPGWPPSLDGLRVALIGDLHAGAPWVDLPRVRAVVDAVLAAQPDLVLLVGDHVADVTFGTHLEPAQVARELAGLLRGDAPVLGVLGNHDWYAGGWRMRAALEDAGLPVLEEGAVPVLDGRLWVAGVGDLWERSPSVSGALAHVPPGAPVLLMTHNPDVVVDVPAAVPLVVAGHTHGGQVAFRGRPYHRVSERTGNRWCRPGWYAEERMYITAGIGSSLVPLRSVTPEVPVLVLQAAEPGLHSR
jgi:predicted MPP superfamily phosphohydrolase